MKLRPAEQIHAETLIAKDNIWSEFCSAVAERIEEAKACGRFMVIVVPHEDVTDPAPIVDELRGLGYTANLTTGDDNKKKVLISWRTPKPILEIL